MKNNEATEDGANAKGGSPISAEVKRVKKSNKSKPVTQDPNREKKKSFRRSWKSASPITKLTLIFLALAALGTLAYVGVSIWQTLEVRWSAHAQHMPLVINSRAPEFLQPFICDVQKGFHTGNMQTAVKNIGNASAYHVVSYFGFPKIIPEKKTGKPFFDALPDVNCKVQVKANELESPLAPGQEMFPQIRQMAGTLPPISNTDPIQLYWVSCVYYSDDYGAKHATCDTYRLMFPSTNPLDVLSGSPTLFCDATPKMGKFAGTISGHCQE
jgi:hypothetical protein